MSLRFVSQYTLKIVSVYSRGGVADAIAMVTGTHSYTNDILYNNIGGERSSSHFIYDDWPLSLSLSLSLALSLLKDDDGMDMDGWMNHCDRFWSCFDAALMLL